MNIISEESNRRHKSEFQQWVKQYGVKVNTSTPGSDLKVGQKVIFKNDYGVSFSPFEVLGFYEQPRNGRCVFLSKDNFWFGARLDQLSPCPNN